MRGQDEHRKVPLPRSEAQNLHILVSGFRSFSLGLQEKERQLAVSAIRGFKKGMEVLLQRTISSADPAHRNQNSCQVFIR